MRLQCVGFYSSLGSDLNPLLLAKHLHVVFGFFFPSQLLHADKRREYLYQLQEFMVTDNSRNWRFRYELAEYVSSWKHHAFPLIRLSVLGLACRVLVPFRP